MRVLCASTAALVAVLVSPPALAQSVDDIVARHIAARGGYEKLRSVQTIKITRTVATPFNDFKVVLYKKRPQLIRVEQSPPGQPPAVRGVNADTAWDTAPGGRSTLRTAPASAEARDLDADFDGLLVDWKAKGHTVTFEGQEALTGAQTYKLKVTTKIRRRPPHLPRHHDLPRSPAHGRPQPGAEPADELRHGFRGLAQR